MSKEQMANNCGSCLYLTREKTFESPCDRLGKLEKSKACKQFRPDLHGLVEKENSFTDLEDLAAIFARMSVKQIALIANLASVERTTRRLGYKFFQRVYVRYAGPSTNNYLSNFLSARILDIDATSIRLIGDNDSKTYLVLQHQKGKTSSLFTAEEFEPLRIDMVRNRKFVDPQLKAGGRLTPTSRKGQIANLDEALDDSFQLKAPRMRKQKGPNDLVSLLSKMDRGMYGTRSTNEATTVTVDWSGEK